MPNVPPPPSNRLCIKLDPNVANTVALRDQLVTDLGNMAETKDNGAFYTASPSKQVTDSEGILIQTEIKIQPDVPSTAHATARNEAKNLIFNTPGATLCLPEPCPEQFMASNLVGITVSGDQAWGTDVGFNPDGTTNEWINTFDFIEPLIEVLTDTGTLLAEWRGERNKYDAGGQTTPVATEAAVGYVDKGIVAVARPLVIRLRRFGAHEFSGNENGTAVDRTDLSAGPQSIITAGTVITLDLGNGFTKDFTFAQNLEYRAYTDAAGGGGFIESVGTLEFWADAEGNMYFKRANNWSTGFPNSGLQVKSGSRVLVHLEIKDNVEEIEFRADWQNDFELDCQLDKI